jgi:antitoxin (DNA-binding transcriptional repressor) of toxin-antitoxin stability system
MKRVAVADLGPQLTDHLEEWRAEGPVVLTEDGRPIALLLVPHDEEELERLVLSHSPRFQAVLEQSRRSIEAGKGLSREAFWQAVAVRAGEGEPDHNT